MAVAQRLASPPPGVIPARGQIPPAERITLFCEKVVAAQGTVERVTGAQDVPQAIARFLRDRNLPPAVRRGSDPRLEALPWHTVPHLEVSVGRSDGHDLVGLSHAEAGVAETGTLVLASGPANPTTINFLTETHIVVVDAADVVGDYETVWRRLEAHYGRQRLPRTVNLITGPSRSGDIEQKLILGAHGPRALHVVVVGGA